MKNDVIAVSSAANYPQIKLLYQTMMFISVWVVAALFTQGGAFDIPAGSVNMSSLIRFVLMAGFFGICLFSLRSWGRRLYQIDNLFVLPLLGLILISIAYTPNVVYGARAFLTIIFLLGLFFAASECLEKKHLFSSLIFSITTISIVSIATYYLIPSFARGIEWDGDTPYIGPRMAGVCGNANNMGVTAAVGIMLVFFYRGFNNGKWGGIILATVPINFMALILTDSRGALLSMLVGIGLSLLTRPSLPRILTLCAAIIFGLSVYFLIDLNAIMEHFSRTGDASKVLTGREATWTVSKELIAERSWFGWGYGSTPVVLPANIGKIGFLASHTHNMVLQILFSIGYVGLGIFGMLILFKAVFAFLHHDSFKMALIYMIIIHGQVEPSVFQGESNMDTLLFALVLAFPYPRMLKEAVPVKTETTSSSDPQ